MLFEVELINISDSPPTANVFKEIDSDHDNQLSREEVRAMARSFSFFFKSRLVKDLIHVFNTSNKLITYTYIFCTNLYLTFIPLFLSYHFWIINFIYLTHIFIFLNFLILTTSYYIITQLLNTREIGQLENQNSYLIDKELVILFPLLLVVPSHQNCRSRHLGMVPRNNFITDNGERGWERN